MGCLPTSTTSQSRPPSEGYGFRADGTIYIDSRSYTRWTYIDLHRKTIDTTSIEATPPAQWDIALHHYDVKTHGATACETPYSTVNEAAAAWYSGEAEQWAFEADRDSAVMVDLSDMVMGNIGYAPSDVNPALSHWMQLDLSHMPPSYSTSGCAYLVQLSDGTVAALKFDDYRDASGNKGYLTLRYQYPL